MVWHDIYVLLNWCIWRSKQVSGHYSDSRSAQLSHPNIFIMVSTNIKCIPTLHGCWLTINQKNPLLLFLNYNHNLLKTDTSEQNLVSKFVHNIEHHPENETIVCSLPSGIICSYFVVIAEVTCWIWITLLQHHCCPGGLRCSILRRRVP